MLRSFVLFDVSLNKLTGKIIIWPNFVCERLFFSVVSAKDGKDQKDELVSDDT